jgi:hypothetical protein
MEKVTKLRSADLVMEVGDIIEYQFDDDPEECWYTATVEGIGEEYWGLLASLMLQVEHPCLPGEKIWLNYDMLESNHGIRTIYRSKDGRHLREACALLHCCLEWDNGGERELENIIEFLNKVEGKKP